MTDENRPMAVRSLRVAVSQIGYVRFCFEAHDGIGIPTTRNDAPDIIDFSIAPDWIDDAEALIDALVLELDAQRVAAPPRSPLLFHG